MKVEDIKITREVENDDYGSYETVKTADVSYRIGDGVISTINEVSNWVGGCYTCGDGFVLDYVSLKIELDEGGHAAIAVYPYEDYDQELSDALDGIRGMGGIGFVDVVCWIDKAINEKLTVEQMVKEAKKDENLSECSIEFRKY